MRAVLNRSAPGVVVTGVIDVAAGFSSVVHEIGVPVSLL
jgi:hypothetical protein